MVEADDDGTRSVDRVDQGRDRGDLQQASRRFFFVLLALTGLMAALLVRPFAVVFLFAAVFAASFSPLYERLTRLLGGRRQLSAVLFGAVFALLILVPVLFGFASVAGDILETLAELQRRLERGGLEGVLERLPSSLQRTLTALRIDPSALRALLTDVSTNALGATGALVKSVGATLLGAALMVIALVVFLSDGRRLLTWLDDVMPLRHGQIQELFREFHKISNSVIIGTLGTGLIQAAVALGGFLITQLPNVIVATFFTFLLSLVPSVGAAGACLVAAGYHALTGHPWRALFLALWAVGVVGVIDNIVKPLLVKRGIELHGALVFFAIVCGVVSFGASGILLGPLIATFAITLIRMYKRDFEGTKSALSTPPKPG